MTMKISLADALEAIKGMDEIESVDDLVALNFEIVGAGEVNVEAQAPTKTEEQQALTDAAELLFEAGRKVAPTREGRAKRILGDEEGIQPYRVVVSKAKNS